jgi:transposase-like protein
MKRKRFTEEQIAYAMRQHEAGAKAAEICRKLGISEATFYGWKKKYAGVGVSELRRSCCSSPCPSCGRRRSSGTSDTARL